MTVRSILWIPAVVIVAVVSFCLMNGCEEEKRQVVNRFQGCPVMITQPSSPHPGMRGLRLTRGEKTVFQIDYGNKNMKVLDWNSFIEYTHAHVEITATIDTTGGITDIERFDIGYGAAADTVVRALRTWRFSPYKSGKVTFVFNASAGIKVDMKELHVNHQYANCEIEDGNMLYVSNARNVNKNYYR